MQGDGSSYAGLSQVNGCGALNLVSGNHIAAVELARYRDAAQRLVRSPWARGRIVAIADRLLRSGSLSGKEVCELCQ